MSLDKLKLNKQLVNAMTDAGFLMPKEVQLKTMSRMLSGQNLLVIGPEGSGKTTAYVLATIMRLKYAHEEAPRALVLTPDKERVDAILAQFELLDKNKSLRTLGLFAGVGMESQLNALADGADVVVATPDRARAIYLKLGLNLNKIQTFIVDDADLMVKKGMQLPVTELARSITKCQHLVFTEVIHERLNKMIQPFLHLPDIIEVEELQEMNLEISLQTAYSVPNFRTKLNLLNILAAKRDKYRKILVFVNNRLTADKVFKNMKQQANGEVAVLKPVFFDTPGFETIDDFKAVPETRVLIVANELHENLDLHDIDLLLHFELPEDKTLFINRVLKLPNAISNMESILFSTDLELGMVKKIEQAIGQKLPFVSLPEELVIEKDFIRKNVDDDLNQAPSVGAAFHEKKARNVKDYNYSSREKAKMSGKIRSRRND
ncbi:MAG: DEAD/DEAH box helicase [Sphingobacteriaceae bacterium]